MWVYFYSSSIFSKYTASIDNPGFSLLLETGKKEINCLKRHPNKTPQKTLPLPKNTPIFTVTKCNIFYVSTENPSLLQPRKLPSTRSPTTTTTHLCQSQGQPWLHLPFCQDEVKHARKHSQFEVQEKYFWTSFSNCKKIC